MKNLIQNISGFIFNQFKRLIPSSFQSKDLTKIYNYHDIPGLFTTSGQPNSYQLKLIAKSGYDAVINLAPNSILEGSVIHEAEILAASKVKYIHIPVNFNHPTKDNFLLFVKSLEENKDKKIWIHCAANMRVSAFVYKYRRDVLGLEDSQIIEDMKLIWSPNRIWNSFLNKN
jgi:protein tyrosine phosphatase (PTP) superfamily phosphohydrolase (DUF442 family)|tara:strand:+ start:164 stop:679 length:516 start_codon:yes stop_codon:yes gene_type:complete